MQDAHAKRVNTFQSLEFLEQHILVHLQSMDRMKQEKINMLDCEVRSLQLLLKKERTIQHTAASLIFVGSKD